MLFDGKTSFGNIQCPFLRGVSFVIKLYFVVVILCFRAYLPANQGAVQPVRTFYHLLLSSMIYIDSLEFQTFPNFNFIKT